MTQTQAQPRAQRGKVLALVHTWLVLDFFGEARRTGGSSSTLTTTIFSQAFLALLLAALLFPDVPPVPFAAANLCLSSVLIALGALADHDGPARRLADRTLLLTAPLRPAHIAIARMLHAGFSMSLVTLGMALPPGVLLAFLCGDLTQLFGYLLTALIASAFATGLLAVTTRLLLILLGPARAALATGSLKALLLAGSLVLFALGLRALDETADALPFGRAGAAWLPPYHLAKLLHAPSENLWRVPYLAAAAVLLVLARIWLQRRERDANPHLADGGLLLALLRRSGLTRQNALRGARLGLAEFVALGMYRSPGFRNRVLPLLGLPVGLAYLTLSSTTGANQPLLALLLQLPAIYLPFLIAFLPHAEHPQVDWLFRSAPPIDLATLHDATWRALVTHVLLPVHGIAAPLILAASPSLATLLLIAFSLALHVLAAAGMTRALTTLPFTLSDAPGTSLDLGSLFAFGLGLAGAAIAFLFLPLAGQAALALGTCALALIALARLAKSTSQPLGMPPEALAQPNSSQEFMTAKPVGLGGELRAILALYGVVAITPTLVGLVFGP